MSSPQKMEVAPQMKFGNLLVLEECEKNKFGHRQYRVRCDCGNIYIASRAALLKKHPRCYICARKNTAPRKPKLAVGTIMNNWKVISIEYDAVKKRFLYQCECQLCKNISTKNHSEIRARKGSPCQQCAPNYHFIVQEGVACGTLPGGERFWIDEEDIDRVSKLYWHIGKGGYIISPHKETTKLRLHHFVLGFEPDGNILIDHINRNRADCRKENLRHVTMQQNAMNSSIIKSSTTGFRGVTFDKCANRYVARIGLNNKRIYLGASKDPIICAQMYNCAAPIIFGEFAGELNEVPPSPLWVKRKVEEKCKPYILEAMIATQPCGISIA